MTDAGPPLALTLDLLPEVLCVARLDASAAVPPALLRPASSLVSLTRTAQELSIVWPEREAPSQGRVERGWVALRVVGPLDFALTGVLARLAQPLADTGISLFAVSTYDTDYVLVRATDHEPAVAALRAAGHTVRAQPPGGTVGE